jgi:hypothetical protein
MANKFKSIRILVIGSASLALTGMFALTARAIDQFSFDAINFDNDTTIEFTALESHGSDQAYFGVMDMMTRTKTILIWEKKPSDSKNREVNEATNFLGTPGNAISPSKNVFKFKSNTPYMLFLESRNSRNLIVSMVYSSDLANRNASQQAKFDQGIEGLTSGGVKINWSSQYKPGQHSDQDFNDFVIVAQKRG